MFNKNNNNNWVCFDCRYSTRQSKNLKSKPKCPDCMDECFCLGDKVEIPPKDDKKEWNKMRKDCQKRLYAEIENKKKYQARQKHHIEKEIIRLENMEQNKDRKKLVNELKERLKTIK